jgi:voltage-gated potassium channel Kch
MRVVASIVGIILLFLILQDGFETIILPRRIVRRFRFARFFYRSTWWAWSGIAHKIHSDRRREFYLSYYGPLSLLLLLITWAAVLIVAFALFQFALGSALTAPDKVVTFSTDLYLSGTTFFTLGYGDVVPREGLARLCAVVEAGLGFGFLAVVISYVPVIYQSFSRREAEITMLDARAGSPPGASEFLRRHMLAEQTDDFVQNLRNWERWCAELLESHLSYPVLMFYRSQHDRQSWLEALTTILDVCALVMIGLDGIPEQAGRFTFAIARHAAVDLSQLFNTAPTEASTNRLSSEDFARLQSMLAAAGIAMRDQANAETRLAQLRKLYEPYVQSLSRYLLMPLPRWLPNLDNVDDWQTSPWDHFSLVSQRPLSRVK